MTRDIPIAVAVMAGGMGRRMGRDKAALRITGISMLERVARVAVESMGSVLVVGRDHAEWARGIDAVRFAVDEYPGAGPLGGIATALRTLGAAAIVVACDMPLLIPEALRWLVGQVPCSEAWDAVVPNNGARSEPLFAVYSPRTLPRIIEALARGERSVQRALAGAAVVRPEVPEWLRSRLANINTPEEFAAAARLLSPGPEDAPR